MGVVYQAYDERLQRTVALKMMLSVGHDETARKRFWREARAAASVNHPNICQLYEIGEDQGELFLAMELLEGEALAERLRRGPLTVVETLPVPLNQMIEKADRIFIGKVLDVSVENKPVQADSAGSAFTGMFVTRWFSSSL